MIESVLLVGSAGNIESLIESLTGVVGWPIPAGSIRILVSITGDGDMSSDVVRSLRAMAPGPPAYNPTVGLLAG